MQQPGGGFRLIIRRGPQPNQIYELNKDLITLGRDITNDITINDPEVSRHHARLTRDSSSGYIMEDLGSTNGTFINGQRLIGARPLSPGETVGLGETVTLAYESALFSAAAPIMPAAQPLQPPPVQPPTAPPMQPQTYSPAAQQQPSASPYAPPPPAAARPSMPPPVAQNMPPMAVPPQPAYYDQQPPSPYTYAAEEQPRRGGMTRWLLLACGCFIVLCIIGSVIALIVIDQTCAWQDEPLSSILETVNLGANPEYCNK